MSQENVRVRRTRKLLREALVELIEERGSIASPSARSPSGRW